MTLPETLTTQSGPSALSWVDAGAPARTDRRVPPDLTVVVTGSDGSDLENLIATLSPRCRRLGAELLVVSSVASSLIGNLARRHQHARFISASANATTAQLRAIGAREAAGDVIVFADERDANFDSWIDSLRAFVRAGPVD